jgi:hypothetical protein
MAPLKRQWLFSNPPNTSLLNTYVQFFMQSLLKTGRLIPEKKNAGEPNPLFQLAFNPHPPSWTNQSNKNFPTVHTASSSAVLDPRRQYQVRIFLTHSHQPARSTFPTNICPNPLTNTHPFVHPPVTQIIAHAPTTPPPIPHPLNIYPKDVTLQHTPNQHTFFTYSHTT